MLSPLALACVSLSLAIPAFALNDGQARTPPMGWRSWEAYYGGVDEKKMQGTLSAVADRSRGGVSLADLGFADVGLDSGFEDCNARKVGGLPAFHGEDGDVLVDKAKFPSSLKSLVDFGHGLNLTVSWYGNDCACHSENSYVGADVIDTMVQGTVNATIAYGFDGLKLDSCSQFNNMSRWSELLNLTGKSVILENCHQGGLVPGQRMPGQQCTGAAGDAGECPYHVFRTSDDIYNSWEHIINNINSVTPFLSQVRSTASTTCTPWYCPLPPSLYTTTHHCTPHPYTLHP